MNHESKGTAVLDAGTRPEDYRINVKDVTGQQELELPLTGVHGEGVSLSSPAGAVARVLAARLRLPDDVSWTLLEDCSGAFLDEARPIGEQVQPGTSVTVIPKTHLGSSGA